MLLRIKWIHIQNVKSINNLVVRFTGDLGVESNITIMRGQNGIGKTTVLECLALFGHLTRISETTSQASDTEVAKIEAEFSMNGHEFKVTLEASKSVAIEISELLSDSTPDFSGWRCKCDEEDWLDQLKVTLARSCALKAPRALSGLRANAAAAVRKLPTRVDLIREGRKHEIDFGFISFINTDLNYFGFDLDIRESPKLIGPDLPKLVDRLGVIDSNGRLLNLEVLKQSWKRVYGVDRPRFGSRDNAHFGPSSEILDVVLEGKGKKRRANVVLARRIGNNNYEYSISTFSPDFSN